MVLKKFAPFENSESYDEWVGRNCNQCRKSDLTAISVECGACPLEYALSMSRLTEEKKVGEDVLKKIGAQYHIDDTAKLGYFCNQIDYKRNQKEKV